MARDKAADIIPIPEGERPPGTKLVARGIVDRDGSVLVVRRPLDDPTAAGLYCLPGGRGKSGEEPPDILDRELREELGRGAQSTQPFKGVRYVMPQGAPWDVHYFIVDLEPGELIPNPADVIEVAWVNLGDFLQYEYLTGDLDVIREYLLGTIRIQRQSRMPPIAAENTGD